MGREFAARLPGLSSGTPIRPSHPALSPGRLPGWTENGPRDRRPRRPARPNTLLPSAWGPLLSAWRSDAALQRQLRLASVAAFASIASMRACDPMLLTLAGEFHSSLGEAALVVSAFAIAYGLLQLFYGPLGERIGKLRVIAFACAGCAFASAIAALAPTLDTLVWARALMGATAAGIVPMTIAWIGDHVPYEERQETLARLLGSTVSGMIAGLWLGAWITETFGWRAVFVVLALTFAAAAVPLHRGTRARPASAVPGPAPAAIAPLAQNTSNASSAPATPEPTTVAPAAKPTAPAWQSLLDLLRLPRDRRVRWVLAMVAIEGALMFGVLAFVPSHLARQHGLGTAAAGSVLALYGVGGLLYSRGAKRLLRALGERGLAILGGTLIGAALLLLTWGGHWLGALPACLCAGAGFYMLHTTLQTQATQMAPAQRGNAVALFACVLFLGQSAGVAAVSVAIDRGSVAWVFSACALALMLLGVAVSRGVGRSPEQVSDPMR
ncbi:MAG: MFS transporter [Rubrivivax sp.]|nr:MFS transporter [Rubrivivax sp.]